MLIWLHRGEVGGGEGHPRDPIVPLLSSLSVFFPGDGKFRAGDGLLYCYLDISLL